MLYLSRREGQAVIIDNAIEVRVVEVRGRTVKLGFNFPPHVSVLREEVFLEIKAENEEAARTILDDPLPEGLTIGQPVLPSAAQDQGRDEDQEEGGDKNGDEPKEEPR